MSLISSLARRAVSTAPPPPLVAPAKDQRTKFVRCAQCGKALTEPLLCSACLCVSYCSETCQRAHWAEHALVCVPAGEEAAAAAAAADEVKDPYWRVTRQVGPD